MGSPKRLAVPWLSRGVSFRLLLPLRDPVGGRCGKGNQPYATLQQRDEPSGEGLALHPGARSGHTLLVVKGLIVRHT